MTIVCCVTGFGSFGDIQANPTEELAQWFPSTSSTGITYLSSTIMVSRDHVDAWMRDTFETIVDEITSLRLETGEEQSVYFIHLGVSETLVDGFALEQYAYNECDFRIPDVMGMQPKEEPISGDCERGSRLETGLPVHTVAHDVASTGYTVSVSDDPGRYVCNYVYYRSLVGCREKATPGVTLQSLFVHVPLEDRVPLDTQKTFLVSLIRHLVE